MRSRQAGAQAGSSHSQEEQARFSSETARSAFLHVCVPTKHGQSAHPTPHVRVQEVLDAGLITEGGA